MSGNMNRKMLLVMLIALCFLVTTASSASPCQGDYYMSEHYSGVLGDAKGVPSWTLGGDTLVVEYWNWILSVDTDGREFAYVPTNANATKHSTDIRVSSSVSKDGNVVYESANYSSFSEHGISIASISTTKERHKSIEDRCIGSPLWSPDGERIGFVYGMEREGRVCKGKKIGTMAADFSDIQLYGENSNIRGFAWSPSGDKIVVAESSEDIDGDDFLRIIDRDTGINSKMIDLSARGGIILNDALTWSGYDGRIYVGLSDGDRSGISRIVSLAADRSDRSVIYTSRPGEKFRHIDVSPLNGNLLVFVTDGTGRCGAGELRLIDVSSQTAKALSWGFLARGNFDGQLVCERVNKASVAGTWSPDGQRIAILCSKECDLNDIEEIPVLISADSIGSDLRLLLSINGLSFEPKLGRGQTFRGSAFVELTDKPDE